jgi:hypothetical protein
LQEREDLAGTQLKELPQLMNGMFDKLELLVDD